MTLQGPNTGFLSLEEWQQALWYLIYWKVDRSDAEDVVHDLAEEILRLWPHAERSHQLGMFRRRLRQRRVDYHRDKTKRSARELPLDIAPEVVGLERAADPALQVVLRDEAQRVMAVFSPRERLYFKLLSQDFSCAEIARKLGIPAARVRKTVSRARERAHQLRLRERTDELLMSLLVLPLPTNRFMRVLKRVIPTPEGASIAAIACACAMASTHAAAAQVAPSTSAHRSIAAASTLSSGSATAVSAPPAPVTAPPTAPSGAPPSAGSHKSSKAAPTSSAPLASTGWLGAKDTVATGADVKKHNDGKTFGQEVQDCINNGVTVNLSGFHCNVQGQPKPSPPLVLMAS